MSTENEARDEARDEGPSPATLALLGALFGASKSEEEGGEPTPPPEPDDEPSMQEKVESDLAYLGQIMSGFSDIALGVRNSLVRSEVDETVADTMMASAFQSLLAGMNAPRGGVNG